MTAAAASSTATPSPVAQMPKPGPVKVSPTREQLQLLDHVLRNLCALGLVRKVKTSAGVTRYAPTKAAVDAEGMLQ